MRDIRPNRSAFFDPRTLFDLAVFFAGVFLALLALGMFSNALAQGKESKPGHKQTLLEPAPGMNKAALPVLGGAFVQSHNEDDIEKSCVYVESANQALGANPASEFESQPEAIQSCFPLESIVQYTFFSYNHGTYTLHAFSGKYVRWQIPDSWIGPAALSSNEIRQLVDVTDMLYAHYAELVAGEPSGAGLLTISVFPDDMGFGAVGYVGSKGIEITAGTLADFKKDIHVPAPGGWLTHEMGHNFDIYHDYLEYYNDGVHAWTDVVQFYLPYYGRWGDYLGGPDDELERRLRKDIVPWDALGSNASWATCVRNGGGCEANGVTANNAWGGLVLRFARLHGTSAMRRVFSYLRDYKATHSTPPPTPEAKNDLLVRALAAGAQMNIACELDTWHWEFSQVARAELAQTYPGQDAFCVDGDGDGFSRARGDLNDHNASIHPGAIEVTNGIDDDCDGVVDDVLVTEQNDFPSDVFQAPTIGSIPLRVTGHASAVDQDAVRVTTGTSKYLKARLRSFGGLQGEFDLGSIQGGGAGWSIFGFTGNTVTNFDTSVPLDADGLLVVKPATGSSGNYEIILDRTSPRPPNPVHLSTSAGSNSGTIQVTATINTGPISGELPTSVRFWANGTGFIQSLPISRNVSFQWTPPAGYCGNGLHAQLFAGDHPISDPTSEAMLGNISTRSFVQTGDNVMIGGLIITGSGQKRVIVRAIGPSLAQYGITNPLQNPTLELHDRTGAVIAVSDNWMDAPNKQAIIDSGLAPANNLESAILTTLDPGNYTAIVRGVNGGNGVGLVEAYDLDPTAGSTLHNISTRTFVQTGDNVMIGGLIVAGSEQKRIIVRAIGPELAQYGIPNPLADPTLELHDGTGALIASNDNWQTTILGGVITSNQISAIQSSGHAPTAPSECAIVADLPPGNYTAIVRGVNNTTGVALVEVYDLQ